jgi:chlorobactene glucosyltransferase
MVVVLLIYAFFIIGTLMWGVMLGLRFKGTLKDAPLPEVLPLVSTVVPARNEERNISRCAQGLVRQNYPTIEMVFVDDDSIDATPDILASFAARDPRIKVVHTQGKPPGWNGKQWACHSGALAAAGDWLCFMDADTYAEPDLIQRTLAFAEANNIDLLTLQPWYEIRGLWERIVLPSGITPLLILFPPHKVNDPKDPMAIANGQFILIRRETYQAVGGHEAVRDRMMDDFSLAEIVKSAGHRLYMVDGSDVMRVRLYTNLREIRSGALKAAVEITGGWWSSVIGLVAYFLITILPVLILFVAILANRTSAILIMGAVVIFQLLYFGMMRIVAFRAPPWSGITYPLGGIIVSVILIDGMARLASGGEIKWKGRDLLGRPELPVKRG